MREGVTHPLGRVEGEVLWVIGIKDGRIGIEDVVLALMIDSDLGHAHKKIYMEEVNLHEGGSREGEDGDGSYAVDENGRR